MAVFRKRSGGGGVLDAPEDIYAQSEWKTPEPAPAGMLQRKQRLEEVEPAAYDDAEDEPYKAKRESMRYKLNVGVPKSVAGKILGGTLTVMLVGAVAGSVLAVRSMLLHDPRFAVASSSAIQVQGVQHVSRDQVLSVFGGDLERNIFKVPLAQRRTELQAIPWVKQATVMRLLPNVVRIALTERTPIAFARNGTQIGLVDADGVLLDLPPDVAGDPKYSFPVLTGLDANDPLSVRKARMEIYQKFMSDLDAKTVAGGPRPSESISEIDLSNPEDVKAVVTGGGDVLVHFGEDHFLKRYQTFEKNLPAWRAQYPKLASVDTRYDNQFVLEMQPGTAVPVNGAAQTPGDLASAPVKASVPAAPVAKSPNVAKHAAVAKAAKAPVKTPVVAANHAAKTAKTAKSKKTAKAGMPSMSKTQIEAMLAAARAKSPANGGR